MIVTFRHDLWYAVIMRLFIAIELNPNIQRTLKGLQQKLKGQGVRGNYTLPDNLHLTLAFIGDYADPDYVLDCMAPVPFEPFPITLDGFGQFGDLWWIGLARNDALCNYVKRLRHALAEAGIPFDRKKFAPHITLVRRASYVIRPEIIIPKSRMTVSHISLFRSDRGKNGMIYTELGSIQTE